MRVICTRGALVSSVPTSGGDTLVGSGGNLAYHVYVDPSFQNIWTNVNPISGISSTSLSSLNLPYYGRVMAKQDVPAGDYQDTITVSISF